MGGCRKLAMQCQQQCQQKFWFFSEKRPIFGPLPGGPRVWFLIHFEIGNPAAFPPKKIVINLKEADFAVIHCFQKFGFLCKVRGKSENFNFLFFCIGSPMVPRIGLHREAGAAPRLYRVRSIKSIGPEWKFIIFRKSVKKCKHSYTGRSIR